MIMLAQFRKTLQIVNTKKTCSCQKLLILTSRHFDRVVQVVTTGTNMSTSPAPFYGPPDDTLPRRHDSCPGDCPSGNHTPEM